MSYSNTFSDGLVSSLSSRTPRKDETSTGETAPTTELPLN